MLAQSSLHLIGMLFVSSSIQETDLLDKLLCIEVGVNSLGLYYSCAQPWNPGTSSCTNRSAWFFTVAAYSEANSFAILQGSATGMIISHFRWLILLSCVSHDGLEYESCSVIKNILRQILNIFIILVFGEVHYIKLLGSECLVSLGTNFFKSHHLSG